MKKLLLLSLVSLSLVSCENHEKKTTEQNSYQNDNTGKNVRDRDSNAITPFDQQENESDLKITQKIRQEVMTDKSLSVDAKNVKIVTMNGNVTLRGPVASAREKDAIVEIVRHVRGVVNVDNKIEIARNR